MTGQTTAIANTEQATRMPRIVTESVVPVLDTGLFEHMHRIATVMAMSSLLPKSLTTEKVNGGEVELPYETKLANAFRITNQAVRWGLDPFSVVDSASVVHGRLCFEGKLVAAVIEAKSAIRLDHVFVGEGEGMRIYLSDVPFTAEEIQQLHPKIKIIGKRILTGTVSDWKTTGANSPWSPKNYQRQLIYRGTRDWTRIYEPALLLGVYTTDEMQGLSEGAAASRRVDTSPAMARLAAARAAQEPVALPPIAEHVEAEIAAMGPLDGEGEGSREEVVDEVEEVADDGQPPVINLPRASEDDVRVLVDLSEALMRATSKVGLKTYAGDFWTKAGGAPDEGDAMHAWASRVYRQHVARVEGSIDATKCKDGVEQIISEVM